MLDKKTSTRCFWAGRRTVEYSMGHAERASVKLLHASQALTRLYTRMENDELRQTLMMKESVLNGKFKEDYETSFQFYKEHPAKSLRVLSA